MSTPIGGAGGFWIAESEVQKAGEAARKVAEEMGGDVKTLYAPCDAASAGLRGWKSAGALDACVEAWAKALRTLAGNVDGAGAAVSSSAKGLGGTDAARRQAFAGLPPYGAPNAHGSPGAPGSPGSPAAPAAGGAPR